MASAIYHHGPWSLEVLPYQQGKHVCEESATREVTFFYLYDTLPLKLGVCLPFTQLGWVPSLSVFLWFFSIRRLEKVGWSSLSSQPRRPLLKPFYESYKFFKDQFFHVCRDNVGPNLLVL
ncbi:hypothetical protein CR513_09879, partial [Mucuna pruriens]